MLTAGLLLVASTIGLGVAWRQRIQLAESALRARIAATGIPESSLRITHLGLGGIVARQVRLGSPPGASVEAIDATWSLAGLWAGRFDTLGVRGARISASLGNGGLSFGSLDPAFEGPSGPLVLPARRIKLEDARVEVTTPFGLAVFALEGELTESPDGALVVALRTQARHPQGELRAEVRLNGRLDAFEGSWWIEPQALELPGLSLGPLRVEGTLAGGTDSVEGELHVPSTHVAYHGELGSFRGESPDVTAHLELPLNGDPLHLELASRGGHFTLPDLALTARGLSLQASLGPDGLGGELILEELRDESEVPRFTPLSGNARFSGSSSQLDVAGRVHDSLQRLGVGLKATADLESGTGELELLLDPLEFEPGGVQPAQLAPLLADWVEDASGEVEGRLSARFEAGRSSLRGELALRELDFSVGAATFQGINGTFAVVGPDPLTTPEEQLLSIALIDLGLPLVDGLVAFRLDPGGVIQVREAHWSWAGGTISTAATTLDPAADVNELRLEASNVDMARLLAQLDLEGLSGTGTVSGSIPLVRRGDQVHVQGALLAAHPPGGTLRYQPATAVESVGRSQPGSMGVALKALSDFRYESLELQLDGDTRGEMKLRIHLRGANPNFQGGRTVEFNVNLEAHLSDLVKAGIASYRVPEVIEQRLRDFSTGGAK